MKRRLRHACRYLFFVELWLGWKRPTACSRLCWCCSRVPSRAILRHRYWCASPWDSRVANSPVAASGWNSRARFAEAWLAASAQQPLVQQLLSSWRTRVREVTWVHLTRSVWTHSIVDRHFSVVTITSSSLYKSSSAAKVKHGSTWSHWTRVDLFLQGLLEVGHLRWLGVLNISTLVNKCFLSFKSSPYFH